MYTKMIGFPAIRLHLSSVTDFKRRKAATKEPETVDWLKGCGDKLGAYYLVDVGANVGGYSLIACELDSRNKALAIEPFPPTFLTLCRNIVANKLERRIVPINALVGPGDPENAGTLSFHTWHSGVAEHPADGPLKLRIPCIDAERLAQHLNQATSIICKIDVDGAELHVIEALEPMLADKRLKSILIECDAETRPALEKIFIDNGFTLRTHFIRNNGRQVNLIVDKDMDV